MSNPNPFLVQTPGSPLTQQHLSDIQNALRALDVAEQQARLAQTAGLDMTTQLNSIAAQRTQLQQIKNTYFPGQ